MSGLTTAEVDALIAAVRTVASDEILPRFRALDAADVDQKSSQEDLVTVADTAAEAALTIAARDILPGARVVGEEAVAADPTILSGIGDPGRTVIIDPIDGTWNYANGVATYGVILAVVKDGETEFGLLYDPIGDDWVMARPGEGAWFQRPGAAPQRLRVAKDPGRVPDSFGLLGIYLFSKPERALLAESLPKFRRSTTLRCSCHEYRLLVQGRADFGLNAFLNPWNHAAGVLAFREAGGISRLLDGRDYAPAMTDGRLLNTVSERYWDELASLWSGLSDQA